MDIAQIECRHAQLRRVLRKSSTNTARMAVATADFMLIRERDRCFYRAAVNVPAKRGRSKKQYARSGGSQRAVLSRQLKGQRYRTRAERASAFKEANRAYRQYLVDRDPILEEIRREGRAATIAAKAGGAAFGRQKRITGAAARQSRALVACVQVALADACAIPSQAAVAMSSPVSLSAPAAAAEPSHSAAMAVPFPADGQAVAAGGASSSTATAGARTSSGSTSVAVALRQQRSDECSQAMVSAAVAHQKRRREDMASSQQSQEQIKSWQRTHSPNIPTSYCNVPISDIQGFACPSGLANFDLIWFQPPLKEMAERALSGNSQTDVILSTALQALRQAWQEKTKPLTHKDVARLPTVVSPVVATCFHAGFCLCSDDDGRAAARAVQSLSRELRPWLTKGGKARQTYELGALVLRLTVRGATPPNDEVWVHVGYGNLNSFHFSVLQLTRAEGSKARTASALGLIALELHDENPAVLLPQNLWEVMRTVKGSTTASVEAFEVHSSKDMVYRLAPGLQVRVKAFHPPLDADFFWEKPAVISDHVNGPGPDAGPPAPIQDMPEFEPSDGDLSNAEGDGDGVGNNEDAPVDVEDSEMASQSDGFWPIEEGSHDESHGSGGSRDGGFPSPDTEGDSPAGPADDDALDHGARGRGRGRAALGRAAARGGGVDSATALESFPENVPSVGAASASQRCGEATYTSVLV